MKKLLSILVLSLLFVGSAYASKTLMYGNYKKNPEHKSYTEHLRSVESGMSWMNGEAKDPIYCPPEELTLNLGNIVTAIDLGVKKLQTLKVPYTDKEIEKIPVEFIMLKGLKVLFPCE
jgi:hypothetical protein